MTRPVVVGVDGSAASLTAAAYAARLAHTRNRPLCLVHGYLHPGEYGVPIDPFALGLPVFNERTQKLLEETAAQLRQEWPGLVVDVRQVLGGPAATLVDESRRAELVVVGSRGLGGFTGLLLGSVGSQVAGHAHCPAVVVRGWEPPERAEPPEFGGPSAARPVLVGLDGSAASTQALRLAADEAALRGTALVVAHAWSVDSWHGVPGTYEELREAAERAAADLLAGAADTARERYPDLIVEARALHTLSTEQSLIDATRDASLVVVGSRGRGGFAGLLLGSVSQALAHHAHCPVMIAHHAG